ncbi:MAG: FHA domain-containing protein [Chloroflexota bacterium]|nr:MAG: FHA domain-containing protein [Chloroflexota bacterium]
MEELLGQSLGRYRLESLLGKGGMGAVYKALDTTLQREVAIKVMNPSLAHQPNFQERFLQEARTAARLNHPNIVQVHDFAKEGEILYIVMEFIPGKTLEKMFAELRAGSRWLLLDEAVQIIRQMALALDYAHRQGVYHRDIKPGNVIIEPVPGEGLPYRPIITDLGLAKLTEGGIVTQVGVSLGTPAYMAPEQALGKGSDARSDIYALGILLFEMVTGRLPFPAKTLTEAILFHVKQPPPSPRSICADIPEALELTILKAIEKDPANRYQDGNSLAKALDEAMPSVTKVGSLPVAEAGAVSLMTQYQGGEFDLRGPSILKDFGSAPAANMDRIQVLSQGKTTYSVVMAPGKTIVGRGKENAIVLDDRKASRQHAMIEFDGKDYRVTDLDSTNGTFMANVKLLPGIPELWTPDKVLQVGDAFLHLQRAQRAVPVAQPAIDATSMSVARPVRRGAEPVSAPAAGEEPGSIGINLGKPSITVEPGQNVQVPLTLLNQGALVDHFQTSVDGIPATWITSLPPLVQLLPGDRKDVTIAIQPPRSSQSHAGTYPVTVRIASQDGRSRAEAKGTLTVTPFTQFKSEMFPVKIKAGRHARIRVHNQGNSPDTYLLSWQDQAVELNFKPPQTQIQVPQGQTAVTEFSAKPRQRPFLGRGVSHPFTAQVHPSGGNPQTHTGEILSSPIIPMWLPPLIVVLCMILTGGSGLYLTNYNRIIQAGRQTLEASRVSQTAAAATALALADDDGDGLSNAAEITAGTDAHKADTDADGLKDGEEINQYGTDPKNLDTDQDTLSDGAETKSNCTSPNNPDTDGDSIPDNVDSDGCMLPTATATPTVTPTPTPVPYIACPGIYQSRLHVGDMAFVSEDPPLANRVREDHDVDAQILGFIQPGEKVEILEGPECGDWIWWKIRSLETGMVGWTSEGDNKGYWLVPLPR